MRQLSRFAISLAVAASCLVATLPTQAPAQGVTVGVPVNQGVRNARNLIRQAKTLAKALDDAPCDFIRRNNILEQSERMPVHVHTAILDAVVLIGGVFLVVGALR